MLLVSNCEVCHREIPYGHSQCIDCLYKSIEDAISEAPPTFIFSEEEEVQSPKQRYSEYFKDFTGDDAVDVYLVHHKFGIEDPSGCLHHASKKLLLSGKRTGGKDKYTDIKEARDTLNRWLEINKDNPVN